MVGWAGQPSTLSRMELLVPLQIASQKQGSLLASENLLRARGPDMTELRRKRLILNAIVRQVQVNVKQMSE